MNNFLKRVKTNALLSAALYALLGLVLLIWPAPSTRLLCIALGLVLAACGLGYLAVFFHHRDNSLYAACHLILGIILLVLGLWLVTQPTLIAVVIPRIIGVLMCIHGTGSLKDALELRTLHATQWTPALILGLVTLCLGTILLFNPFGAFTTVVRFIGAFLIYDGISSLWITLQLSRAADLVDLHSGVRQNAVDVDFQDLDE